MTEKSILFNVDGDIATITLNRPDAGNALDESCTSLLLDATTRCELDPAIRCVVLTGRGKLFCGGGDIGGFRTAGDDIGEYLSKLAGILHMSVTRLMRMPKPLLVSVNGPAAGAGMSLALAGDVVIAGRSANFTTAYGAIGLTADLGMSWHLPRLVGMRRAQDLLYTSRRVASDEALEIGLVTAVVDDDALAEETAKRARRLADGAIGAIGRTKALLLNTYGESLETQLEYEARAITHSGMSAESREGVSAFLEKRKPVFKQT